jgi:hypothetical protein
MDEFLKFWEKTLEANRLYTKHPEFYLTETFKAFLESIEKGILSAQPPPTSFGDTRELLCTIQIETLKMLEIQRQVLSAMFPKPFK